MAEKQTPVAKPTAQTTEQIGAAKRAQNSGGEPQTIELTEDEKLALAEKRKLAVKAANDTKIAELLTKIAEADDRLKWYQGDHEDKVAFREFTKSTKPEAWKAINELPELLRNELKEFQLSILHPDIRKHMPVYEDAKIRRDKAVAEMAETHALILKLADGIPLNHPDFVNAPVQKAAKQKTAKTGETTAESKDGYMGTLLSNEAATAKTIEVLKTLTGGKTVAQYLKDGGTLSESETVKLIYPGDYSYAAKGSDGRSPLKFHYHTIWNKLVLSQR